MTERRVNCETNGHIFGPNGICLFCAEPKPTVETLPPGPVIVTEHGDYSAGEHAAQVRSIAPWLDDAYSGHTGMATVFATELRAAADYIARVCYYTVDEEGTPETGCGHRGTVMENFCEHCGGRSVEAREAPGTETP